MENQKESGQAYLPETEETTRQKKAQQQEYAQYVKEITPTKSLPVQMAKAFFLGGLICVIGQGITGLLTGYFGLDKETAASWCSLLLILLSVVLTGLNLYSGIVTWGGAGALVPITGFANSIASAAMEFKKEGWVFGVGCKIFTIAGPVILYGIFTSWVLGLICYVLQLFGMG